MRYGSVNSLFQANVLMADSKIMDDPGIAFKGSGVGCLRPPRR